MANRTLLLCLVLSISLACYFESAVGSPKSGGYSSRSSRPSSSSSGSSWSSRNSKPSYPSSGGLSGYGSGSSKQSYPSSSSGLSGSSSGSSWSSWNSKPSYPSSGGLSGYGTGSGSSSHSYPQSSSGLSGSGKSPPSSNSGSSWSWWGSGSSSSSNTDYGTHSYPSSHGGLSGTGTRPTYEIAPLPAGVEYANKYYGNHNAKPSYTNNNNYGTHHQSATHGTSQHPATHGTSQHAGTHVVNNHVTNVFSTPYYSSPQYVYVTDYRNSGSRYGDLLTGLTLYNMGRSHSHYDDHYYHDDYYRRRYNSDGNVNSNYSPQKTAVCTMRITENGHVETLKIPCEIVSTFTKEGQQVTIPQSQVNTTTCVTNSTLVNNTAPVNATSVNSTLSSNVTMMNSTTCTFTVNATDPLKVKGPPLNTSNMQCEVEIRTSSLRTINKVDCATLMRYSKMPEPKRDNFILPEKQKLKTLLHNPPWWMSLFIAV